MLSDGYKRRKGPVFDITDRGTQHERKERVAISLFLPSDLSPSVASFPSSS